MKDLLNYLARVLQIVLKFLFILHDIKMGSMKTPLFNNSFFISKFNKNYFTKDFINELVIEKAQKAYVVSPVSSLIVLETKQDYERFSVVADEARNTLDAVRLALEQHKRKHGC